MQLITTKSFQLAIDTCGDVNAKKLALVLPGRLDTKDYFHISSHLEFLASLGYFAVSLDPPGTWQSPGDISLFTTTNYLQAISELIEFHGNKPTILMGHSRGGTVAIHAGTTNPNVQGVIAIMASLDGPSEPSPLAIKNGYELESRDLPPGKTKSKEQKTFSLPLFYFQDGQKYDTLKVLQGCSKPKLLFYATQDDFSDPSDYQKVFATLPDPKELHELNCTHDYRYSPSAVEEVNQVAKQFLLKYLHA